MKRYGALETGGTKMVLAVLDEQGNFLERAKLPTKTPQETMAEMIAFFREHPVSALGIGSFGPLCLDPALGPGEYRPLTDEELRRLREAADLSNAYPV